jgi:hypothetical protein
VLAYLARYTHRVAIANSGSLLGASVVTMIAAGWYSQRLLARGTSGRLARGVLGGGCAALGGAALAIMPYFPGFSVRIALTTTRGGVAIGHIRDQQCHCR